MCNMSIPLSVKWGTVYRMTIWYIAFVILFDNLYIYSYTSVIHAGFVIKQSQQPTNHRLHQSTFHRFNKNYRSRTKISFHKSCISVVCMSLQQQPSSPLCIQVISDVDDTLKSSGGVNIGGIALGGIDTQYDRNVYYPGVAEFMLQLSLGTQHSMTGTNHHPPAKVAILTARAEEFKSFLELKPDNPLAILFRNTGQQSANISDWGFGPVLYGSVAEWIIQDRKGLRKFTNFEKLIQQDPKGKILNYIYVGDTGELDEEAGMAMLREYPHLIQAVFLHVVSNEPNQHEIYIPPPKIINGRMILYFRTYVGAATSAVQYGFISMNGLQQVIQAARISLAEAPKSSDKWLDLQRDINCANNLFGVFL